MGGAAFGAVLDAVVADGAASGDGVGEDTVLPHPAVETVAKSVAPATAWLVGRHIAGRSLRFRSQV